MPNPIANRPAGRIRHALRAWLILGLWSGLALSLGRIGLLFVMGLAHGVDLLHVQLRVTAALPGVLFGGVASGFAATAALIVAHGLRSRTARRFLIAIVGLTATCLFLWWLAGWNGPNPGGRVGIETSRGLAVVAALGAGSLAVATALVLATSRLSSASVRTSIAGVLIPLGLITLAPGTWRVLVLRLHPETHPNVIWIIVDTLRADAVLDSAGKVHTPNLDALARDGIQFERAYSHAPLTLPSHIALFSSRSPHRSGVINNGQRIPADLPLFPVWIRSSGYVSRAAVSIGALRSLMNAGPREGAFEQFVIATPFVRRAHESQPDILSMVEGLPPDQPFFLFAHYADPHSPYCAYDRGELDAEVLLDGKRLSRMETSNASYFEGEIEVEPGGSTLEIRSAGSIIVQFIRLRRNDELVPLGQPTEDADKRTIRYKLPNDSEQSQRDLLCLWVSDAPGDDESIARYTLEVEYVDRFVGELMQRLKDRGLYDESLIVMTSDHGEGLGEHGRMGHGSSVYDELIHVPLIIKLPRNHPLESALEDRAQELVRHMDIVPTVLQLIEIPDLPGQMGVSLLESAERVHFAEAHPDSAEPVLCLQDERYKLMYRLKGDRFEFYDLLEDPDELNNLFRTEGILREAWIATLREAASLSPTDLAEPDPETAGMLQALGYMGDD